MQQTIPGHSLSPPPSTRPPLPDRQVTSNSIEEAYVTFILHCNPAVPLETDSAALREAFRTPPKSGGKSFSTFTLFQLIKQLETKELKTWAELALKLGVEPPDQEKGQSSQKIQQYAVRLKRWMHSMHVDAFFEYLMDRPHPYWTEIPSDQTPITETGRDGVAAEDDMALRALLPQIKPRRGRRKPDEDDTGKSPSQRPSPQADDYSAVRTEGPESWTAQPVERGSVFLFPAPNQSRLGVMGQPPAPSWSSNADMLQTPLTAYPHPHSAITPSTRNSFWADEPKSAITPSKGRSTSRRHGAKVVSSAWRLGGPSGSGKTRGRPPINRMSNPGGPFSAFPASDIPIFKLPSPTPDRTAVPQSAISPTSRSTFPPVPSPIAPPRPPSPQVSPQPQNQDHSSSSQQQQQQQSQQESVPPRPAKRSRLSLQVPARVGGEVRLATPPLPPLSAPATAPPIVMVNGLITPQQDQHSTNHHPQDLTSLSMPPLPADETNDPIGDMFHPQGSRNVPAGESQQVFFKDLSDRTNINEIESFFVHEIMAGSWLSSKGKPIPPCEVDEAWGVAQSVVENLLKAAPTKEAFLINLAALAGGRLLMESNGLKITRLDDDDQSRDRSRYSCDWELRFGDIRGKYSMQETVLHEKWQRNKKRKQGSNDVDAEVEKDDIDWKKCYAQMVETSQRQEQELAILRGKIVAALKDSREAPVDH
ncbi:ARS binding protein 2-domain-containing protein [Apodospora peruviana]|uniref:ARS binding protein 2-domain-containing protein n=1 Tax=Apodospora peruviana TaxID=516989 RepID=A0AAE0HXJ4_9PEZI|nr:ARS binding protein 2-domain-containing protein [Apodospora peruviana]